MNNLKHLYLSPFVFLIFIAFGHLSKAQDANLNSGKKVNLDDIKIKGEVNKGQFFSKRKNRINLDSRIKIPKNFHNAIVENLDPELNGISKLESSTKSTVPRAKKLKK